MLTRTKTTSLVACTALTALVAVGATSPGERHFGLRTSQPVADATVESPEAVRLWFTQAPQESSARVRVIDAGQDLVPVGALEQDPEDATHFVLPVEGTLPAGHYTVAWRGIGQDGHVVDGDFAFTVAAPR